MLKKLTFPLKVKTSKSGNKKSTSVFAKLDIYEYNHHKNMVVFSLKEIIIYVIWDIILMMKKRI